MGARLSTAVFAAMISSTVAAASDGPPLAIPKYDVERNCSLVFPSHNGHYNQCIAEEEGAYRVLFLIWERAPEEARDFCADRMNEFIRRGLKIGGNIYPSMVECVMDRTAKYDAEHPEQPRRKFAPL